MPTNQNITGVNVAGNLNARDISVVLTPQFQDPLPKNIRFKIEKPIRTFTGRKEFLKQFHKVVKKGQGQDDRGITVLTQAPISVVAATGGIGKTETVRRYVQLHEHEYDHIVWIDSEKTSSAKTQFAQLATELKIWADFEGKPKEFESILKEIFEKLLLNAHVVLLVFDNAEAFEDDQDLNLSGIRSLIPKSLSPFCIEPTIIVTSRNQNWNLQNVIRLDLWTEEEVIFFVIRRLELDQTLDNVALAVKLGNLFGRLPIALQAAVAVILQQLKHRNKTYGIQNLINEYESGSRTVLGQKPTDANMRPNEPKITMLVLWNISLEKIVQFPKGELAIKILCFMAYMSPTCIPQDFLYALFKKNCSQDAFQNALDILEDYSLVAWLSSSDSDSPKLSIHRMIQDATIENLRKRDNDKKKSHSIFHKNTFLGERDVIPKLSKELIEYFKTLKTTTYTLELLTDVTENFAHVLNHRATKLHFKHCGDLTDSIASLLKIVEKFRKCEKKYNSVYNAPSSFNVRKTIFEKVVLKRKLIGWLKDDGHGKQKACLDFRIMDDVTTRALGSHHAPTLLEERSLAETHHTLRRYEEAVAKYKEVLQNFQNYGDAHSKAFLYTQHNYASLLLQQRKTNEAFKFLTQVLQEQVMDLELNPEELLITKSNIVSVLTIQGEFEKASKLMEQNVSDAILMFGPFHLETLRFKRIYAELLHNQGKHDLAAPLLLELLETEEAHLGSEHPETLETKINLASVYIETKELDKAFTLLDVEACEKNIGLTDSVTLRAAHQLARVLNEQGKFGDALTLFKRIGRIEKQLFGPNNALFLNTMINIASLYCKIKELDLAVEVLQDVSLSQLKTLGKNHPKTIGTLKYLTLCRICLFKQDSDVRRFMRLTLVNAASGRSLLQASNWNMKVALFNFRYLNLTQVLQMWKTRTMPQFFSGQILMRISLICRTRNMPCKIKICI